MSSVGAALQLYCHLGLKLTQGLDHAGYDHPGIRSKEQHRLHHGLKNKPDTRGATPSLLRMRTILLQTVLAWDKFLTNSGQLLSAANITRPRYLKEVTISRGSP